MDNFDKSNLSKIYDERSMGTEFTMFLLPQDDNNSEKYKIINSLEYLKEEGYIEIKRASGFYAAKLTSKGINFAKNNFTEINNVSTNITGDNNVYIATANDIGTIGGNTINNNNTTNMSIPEEYKKLIEELLKDIDDNKIPKEKLADKVKNLISNILKTTATSTAAKIIVNLIMQIVSKK